MMQSIQYYNLDCERNPVDTITEEIWTNSEISLLDNNQSNCIEGIQHVSLEYKMMEERENIQKMVNQQQITNRYPFNLNQILANNNEKYLHDCRFLISEKLMNAIPEHKYHRKQFERLSDWEILEYRYSLEKDIQKGIHALNQVQILEMLLQERKKRRTPEYVYQMGSTANASKIVEGLAFALNLRIPTPLVNIAVNMLKKCTEGKQFNTYETAQQRKQFELKIIADALHTVKGCELHRNGEIGDLACRFNHLYITEME